MTVPVRVEDEARAARFAAADAVPTLFVVGLCAIVLAPTLTFRMGTDQGDYSRTLAVSANVEATSRD
jgi:hypothetical protein